MNPKTKTLIILLTPIGLVLAALWFAAVFNALIWLSKYGQDVGTEMWWRTMLTLASAGGFAAMAYFFVKVLRGKPEIKKRREKGYTDIRLLFIGIAILVLGFLLYDIFFIS